MDAVQGQLKRHTYLRSSHAVACALTKHTSLAPRVPAPYHLSGAPPAIAPLFRPSSKGARLPASAACKPHVPPPSLCAAAAASQVAPRVCPAPAARDERPPGNTPNTDPTAASASTPTTTITCREQLLETIGLLLSVPVRYPYIHLQELHLTMGDWPAGLQLKQELFPTLTSLSVRLGAPGELLSCSPGRALALACCTCICIYAAGKGLPLRVGASAALRAFMQACMLAVLECSSSARSPSS